jgi:SAM-dependent methyltransferase
MESLVNYIEHNFINLKDKKVLDVGCNDGCLLDYFKKKGALTYGVEPTDAAEDAQVKFHNITKNYFTPKLASNLPKFDVITFTNVFAHIENLTSLLKGVSLASKSDTLLVIENHYLGGVLDKNQFDTFYHEHPRTYSLNSFIHIAKKLNKDILSVEFPSRYGGNIRVVIGDSKIHTPVLSISHEDILKEESKFLSKFRDMNNFITQWKIDKKREILSYVKNHGKISSKAFPARAAIPLKLLGLDETHIKCVHEKPGSVKIGHYVPGTKIPIVSDDEIDINSTQGLLNNAWHIGSEIQSYLKKLGYKGDIINII